MFLGCSGNSLDGKSLICELTSGFETWHPEIRGFQFIDGEVLAEELQLVDDDIVLSAIAPKNPEQTARDYSANRKEVNWWGEYTLDKKNLKLLYRYEEMIIGRLFQYEGEYHCEMLESANSYSKTMAELHQNELQELRNRLEVGRG